MIILMYIGIALTCIAIYNSNMWLFLLSVPFYMMADKKYIDLKDRLENLEFIINEIFNANKPDINNTNDKSDEV